MPSNGGVAQSARLAMSGRWCDSVTMATTCQGPQSHQGTRQVRNSHRMMPKE